MSMDIFVSKDVLTVRRSHLLFSLFDLIMLFLVGVDVINVSGHLLSTAEIESALIMHKGVAETAGTFIPRYVIDLWIHSSYYYYGYRNSR